MLFFVARFGVLKHKMNNIHPTVTLTIEHYKELEKAYELVIAHKVTNGSFYYSSYEVSVIGDESKALEVMKAECERLKERNKELYSKIDRMPYFLKWLFKIEL